jgi:hypothetical protein
VIEKNAVRGDLQEFQTLIERVALLVAARVDENESLSRELAVYVEFERQRRQGDALGNELCGGW